jgi:GT2 family glycosyltransferase
METLIVIVNYRTGDLVVDCLRSLAGEVAAAPGTSVVVTDNASGDGSAERIAGAIREQGWEGWARLVALERNGGFSYGNNEGIRPALAGPAPPGLVMLLNPDTIVRPGAITSLARFFAEHPRAGIVGSQIEDIDGNPMGGGGAHRLPTPLTELDAAARIGLITRLVGRHAMSVEHCAVPQRCEWVSGAAMTVRREVFEQVGLLDDGFFLYFDELDFCRRALLAGWEIWHLPESRVVHFVGAATGINEARKRRGRWWYDSRRRFYIKAYGVAGLVAADALWALGRVLNLARRLVTLDGSPTDDPKRYTLDLLGGDLRAILTGEAWTIDRHARPT